MLHHFSHVLLRTPLQSLARAYRPGTDMSAIFREGLYLSSPEYWNELQKRDQLTGKDKEKLELSFNKYWLRSSSRCTPYGTFAGMSLANISDKETAFVLRSPEGHTRRLRLDMNYLSGIIQVLEQMPEIQKQLRYYTNNSLYELPDGFRYAEYAIENNTRNYHLTSIEKTAYIQAVLQAAREGATLDSLVQLLRSVEEVTEEEAMEFLSSMIGSQLLISGLEPSVTGDEPLDQLIDNLDKLPQPPQVLEQLRKVQTMIRNPSEDVSYYQSIEQELLNLGLALEVPKNTLQVDLYLDTAQQELNQDLIAEITTQAESLFALARQSRNGELEDFKKNFYARYEDNEVPLAVVLDADLGIGYAGVRDESAGGGPMIDDIAFAGGGSGGGGSDFDFIQQYTLGKYNDFIKEGRTFIEIKPEELEKMTEQSKNYRFATSMHLMGSLLKQEGQPLSPQHFVFDVSGMGGPSAGNLLGRFTHGDPALCALTREVLQREEEENPDALYAEIAHLPQARIGNILLRPVLRRYEIPYIGKSGLDEAHQIPVEDLMVSVRNSEVILRSKKHNKRVFPRLTTAHNFGYRSLPVYKFLCDLQTQGLAFANIWDWGHFSGMKHLPRVVYKNLVLQKAVWRVEEGELKELPKAQEAQAEFIRGWREKLHIPARVVYKEGDNELLLDLEEPQGIALFLHYLRRYKKITLEEFLFTEENCVVFNEAGEPFTNELVIPLHREVTVAAEAKAAGKEQPAQAGTTPAETQEPAAVAAEAVTVARKFSLFSEWLYFKIYTGTKSAEKVLRETLLEFVEQGLEHNLFEHFFFIRYRDDFSHIRLRFYNSDPNRQLEVQKQLMLRLQPMIEDGMIDKVSLDTYSRELERYGGNLIEESELLFHNDSLAILRFINLLDGADGERYRFLFAMRGIDMLLSDFGFSLEEKTALARQIQGGFFREFGGHPSLQKLLNDKYRKQQKTIFAHMDAANDVANEIEEGVAVFEERSAANEAVIRRIREKVAGPEAQRKIEELLPSYIHMFMNRLFIAQQRKYELVVYHFLERYYSSQLSIQKKGKTDGVHRLQTT